MNKQNYPSIDLAKFVCAILVVMIHTAPLGAAAADTVAGRLNFGLQHYLARIAIPFFFVSSGFFLYGKTSLAEFHTGPTKRYALRLLRLYATWTFLYLPLVFYGFFRDDKGVAHAVFAFVRDTVFTGSCFHLWYLNATIFAVLLTSALLSKKIDPRMILAASLLLYLVGLLAQSWFGLLLPLKNAAPSLWALLRLIKKVIVTTRDGLFDAFPFVAMGMCFAFFRFTISKGKALAGFALSMLLLFLEAVLLQYFHFSREHDMYLFLIPAAFFGFCFLRALELPAHKIYGSLRKLSALIFYLHVWIAVIVGGILREISTALAASCVKFVLVLALTIACAYVIMKLSDTPGFKWLGKLYR